MHIRPLSPSNFLLVTLICLLAACAPATPARPATDPGVTAPAAPRVAKTLTIALQGEPAALDVLMGGDIGGSPAAEMSLALNERLSQYDNKGNIFPQLATDLPSLDKGTWVVNADGTMQTTYRLRPNIHWHDGQPLTARDVVFSWTVARDTELPIATREVANQISAIETPDDTTLIMRWVRSYPLANVLAEVEMAPRPVHLLQETYATDKERFQRLGYWGKDFVGVGPYRVERWDIGSRFVFTAFDGYYGARPKIDTLNFVFIADEAATAASLFAGAVDGELRGMQPKAVLAAKKQWEQQGKKPWLALESVGMRAVEIQYRDQRHRELLDVRTRRGLLQAIDRETIGEAVYDTAAPQANGPVPPDDPRYAWMKSVETAYPYDQRRALELLSQVGWQRGPSGAMANAAGEPISVGLMTTDGAQWVQTQAITADAWRGIGIAADEVVLSSARARDREVNSTFPTFNGAFYGLNYLQPARVYASAECAGADNRWTGANRGCYQSPDIDRVAQGILTAVDPSQQQRLWGDLARVYSDQLPSLPLYYVPWASLFREGVTGPKGASWRAGSSSTWNVGEWDVN